MTKPAYAWAVAALLLAGCGDAPSRPSPVSSATISYRYDGALHGSGLDEVTKQAADYCQRKFKQEPYLIQDVLDQGFNRATFECR